MKMVYSRGSGSDQENCVAQVEGWKVKFPEDNFFYRPYDKDGDRLLFVHQTNRQRHLMKRYGDELSCLDATYKTTKFSLYLFFVVVKTNMDYQVCSNIISQIYNATSTWVNIKLDKKK